jgi:RNA polymerase sigma factor (sigma-70 family)
MDAPTPTTAANEVFEDFYRREPAASVRSAWLLTGSRVAAEDVVQDAMTSVFGAYDRIQFPSAYLRRAVVNAAKSRERDERRHRKRVLRQERSAAVNRSDAELLELIAELPYRQRVVIIARYWGGWSEQEITYALGCRPGTVKSHQPRRPEPRPAASSGRFWARRTPPAPRLRRVERRPTANGRTQPSEVPIACSSRAGSPSPGSLPGSTFRSCQTDPLSQNVSAAPNSKYSDAASLAPRGEPSRPKCWLVIQAQAPAPSLMPISGPGAPRAVVRRALFSRRRSASRAARWSYTRRERRIGW